MSSYLTEKFTRRAVCLLPVALVAPSVIWIAADKSVWMWDQSIYGKGSVELFYVLVHSPERWLRRLHIPQSQAPGVSWLGEFFVPLGYLLGSIDMGLLVSIILTQAVTLMLVCRAFRELSDHNEPVAMAGCLAIASAPLFVAMSHQYLTEPLQLCAEMEQGIYFEPTISGYASGDVGQSKFPALLHGASVDRALVFYSACFGSEAKRRE